eukprot:g7383.t1
MEKFGDNIDSEGKFTAFEILYRNIFKRWFLDKGLVGEFMSTVLDLGAGGGHYTTAFNDTGLVVAQGYDATVNLLPIEVDLEKELVEFTHGKFAIEKAPVFLENLNYLAKQGMVLSWAGDELCGLGWGHVNCLKEPLQTYVEARTDFVFDAEMTARLRNSSEISWIQKSVSFFRKRASGKRSYNYDPAFGEVAAQQYYARLERIKQQQKNQSTTSTSALVDRKKQPSKHHAERGKYVQMILNAPVLRVPEQRKHTVVMTKTAIQRGIYELDKINELHKSRRPKGEPAPDLLNYKEVFKALERDYGGEKLDQRIGVHE